MADAKKLDPFRPAQPSIPGVPAAAAPAQPVPPPGPAAPEYPRSSAPRTPMAAAVWVAIGFIVAVALGVAYWSLRSDSKPRADSDASPVASAPAVGIAGHARNLPVGPGIIGSIKDVEKPWSSKQFLFRSDLSSQPVPSLVVHLPNGQYWGFSMIEPFGSCKLEYITDLGVLQTEYDFRANHPMVGDPCTHAVYDLLQYDGGAPDGGLVRGAIVHGPGVRPPMAIEIELQGKQLRAVRME